MMGKTRDDGCIRVVTYISEHIWTSKTKNRKFEESTLTEHRPSQLIQRCKSFGSYATTVLSEKPSRLKNTPPILTVMIRHIVIQTRKPSLNSRFDTIYNRSGHLCIYHAPRYQSVRYPRSQ